MTEKETAKALTLLSAFYGEGKAEVYLMVKAWQELLADYEYFVVRRAIFKFAKNDTREYASFPTPGTIIMEIKNEYSTYSGIFNALLNDQWHGNYEKVPDYIKQLFSADQYDRFMALDYQERLNLKEDIILSLKYADKKLYEKTMDETARETIAKCGKDAFEEIERREHELSKLNRQIGRKS